MYSQHKTLLLHVVKSADKKDFKPLLFRVYSSNICGQKASKRIYPSSPGTVTLRD